MRPGRRPGIRIQLVLYLGVSRLKFGVMNVLTVASRQWLNSSIQTGVAAVSSGKCRNLISQRQQFFFVSRKSTIRTTAVSFSSVSTSICASVVTEIMHLEIRQSDEDMSMRIQESRIHIPRHHDNRGHFLVPRPRCANKKYLYLIKDREVVIRLCALQFGCPGISCFPAS